MPIVPPHPDADQSPTSTPVPEWPPHLAALIAELDSPRAKAFTSTQTGQQYDLVVQQLPTSTAPAREFGLPGMTPLAVNLLRRVGQPGVIFELVYSDPVADGSDEQLLTYRAVDARGAPAELQVWRMRAYCRGVAVYGQVRWHVLAGMWQALEWDGPWPPAAAFKQATAALREILDLRKRLVSHAGGRHRRERDAARRKLRDAADQLGPFADRWALEAIADLPLARAAIRTVRTIGNWKERAEWDIDAIRADAATRHISEPP